jgi:uncharacterized ParB-like nuclease family protein
MIELSKLRIDAGTQSRCAISEDTVSQYAEALEQGDDLPPIMVFFDGLDYYIGDGFHRYHAHKRIGREFIDCNTASGTVRDAIRYSLQANTTHGLPRSNADKRKAVLTALNDPEWSEMSLRDIADLCRVTHPFVLKVKRELVTVTTPEKPAPKVEEEISEPDDGMHDDLVSEVVAENERLKDRLAVEVMDATEEEKLAAKETIDSLREQVKILSVELEAVKKSRDQYQKECSELLKQIKILQRKK